MHGNCFSNFCGFRLISEGVASAPTVYSFLKNGTKVFLTFVPRSFFFNLTFGAVYSRVCSKADF
ncbi:hypothetical protein FNV40_12050 [Enterococcus durans]|nr:hypothetical protein FNV40_12050 [Enterococcus durans]